MAADRVGVALGRRGDFAFVRVGNTTAMVRRRRVTAPVEVGGVRWVVARVVPGCEFGVADDLAGAGFRVFAPHRVRVSFRSRVRASEQRVRVERDSPVFAGYVFVGCPEGLLLGRSSHDRILDVLSAPDGRHARRLAAAVAAISDLHGEGVWDGRLARASRFVIGDRVRVSAGAFAGFPGWVEALPNDMRVVVDIRIFGRPTRVEMASGHVEPAGV